MTEEANTFYILVCLICDPDAQCVLPFGSAQARGQWAAAHRDGTGHDSWWCPDITDDGRRSSPGG